jgi:hypothetical protein
VVLLQCGATEKYSAGSLLYDDERYLYSCWLQGHTLTNITITMAIQQLSVKELHPTFAAELSGVDFTKPISPEQYTEIRRAVDKVSRSQKP